MPTVSQIQEYANLALDVYYDRKRRAHAGAEILSLALRREQKEKDE